MARKTKEELNKINEEIVEKSTKKAVKSTNKNKTVAKSKSAVKSAVKKEPAKKVKATSKKKNLKKETTKKETAKKKTTKKEPVKKATNSSKKESINKVENTSIKEPTKKVKATSKKEPTKEVKTTLKTEPIKKAKTTSKKEATKKVKNEENENIEPKTVAKKTNAKTTTKKKTETKKATTTKKKAETKKASTTKKKSTSKKSSTTTKKKTTAKKASTTSKKKLTAKKSETESKVISLNPIEYYDLPYRYNETVVKVLAQNPNTLFVYWDISDNDRENFENQYGKLFFYNTRPVLVIHNLTDNYSFEIDIDDFANNWYVNVNDTKCKYFVELGRRPKYDNHDAIPVNYLKVASSNTIEMPNDHILFFKDNDRIYFKNIKTNRVTEKIFKSRTYSSKLKGIYSNYNLSEKDDRFDFKNPSSQNPTSNVL